MESFFVWLKKIIDISKINFYAQNASKTSKHNNETKQFIYFDDICNY